MMNQLVVLLIFFSIAQQGDKIIRGTVTWNQEPMPGWNIKISGTESYALTDFDGKFSIEVGQEQELLDLEAYYLDGSMSASTRIVNIEIKGDTLDIGNIPVYFNKEIDKKEFKNLDSRQKDDYQLKHYVNPNSGYIHKQRIDTSRINVRCPYDSLKELRYNYMGEDNIIVLDFQDIKKCK